MGRRYIAGPGELSIPFLLDEKPDVVPGDPLQDSSLPAFRFPVVPSNDSKID